MPDIGKRLAALEARQPRPRKPSPHDFSAMSRRGLELIIITNRTFAPGTSGTGRRVEFERAFAAIGRTLTITGRDDGKILWADTVSANHGAESAESCASSAPAQPQPHHHAHGAAE